jgi:hypothetical protein
MRADIDEGFLVDVSARELRDEARNRSHPLASVNSTERRVERSREPLGRARYLSVSEGRGIAPPIGTTRASRRARSRRCTGWMWISTM